ncbi:MAG: DNA repair protein RadC [Treponemataceae bacterium]|nr:DNA repair protein RadC [Treponemataceae bacterium]
MKLNENTYCLEGIKSFWSDGKPDLREQLVAFGESVLSDKELIMLLLGTGIKGVPVAKLAEKVLFLIHSKPADKLKDALLELDGMGQGKTACILAALECGRRFAATRDIKVNHPSDILPLVQSYSLEKQEHFLCVSMNGAREVLKVKVVSVGTMNRALVHPRDLFADPIVDGAAAIIIVHNHPSGSVTPSPNDYATTRRILGASRLLGIQLLDHIIITRTDFFSFLEKTDVFSEEEQSGCDEM